MYLERAIYQNVGPLKEVNINFPLDILGNPKPVIIVGENGSGKSTFLSNIVDAFYEMAGEAFSNARQSSDSTSHQYYKTISGTEIHHGTSYMVSYLSFTGEKRYFYSFKSGAIKESEFKSRYGIDDKLSWSAENHCKHVSIKNDEAEKEWKRNVICYFGPDRYEKPFWMGGKYYSLDDYMHPSVSQNWNGHLSTPISVKNVTAANLQWLLDVIADSRADIGVRSDGSQYIEHVVPNYLRLLRQARTNIELVLSKIVGEDVYFDLNFRNAGGNRFCIKRKKDDSVFCPTLDSLSTGQIALFNMFSTIVRYGDNNNINQSINLENITGIVVIDEIELHLHSKLQKEVLPSLMHLFPKIQFIISSHSPLFLLGMREEYEDDGFEIYEFPSARKIDAEKFSEFKRAYEYVKQTDIFHKDAEEAVAQAKKAAKTRVLVVTEGATDWKHMKTAMMALKEKSEHTKLFDNLDFDFLEYEPANSKINAQYKLEMGNSTLTSICESYSKMPQDTKYIFIADRDYEPTNKKLGGGMDKYRKWRENVYSFIIPVPQNRVDTPQICIEHLYSDAEIKTEITCDDGVSRRLYMGNEFDSRGLAQKIDRFCERASICGPEKISIIEGSQGDRITSISHSDGVENYALPKMKFSQYVSEHPEEFSFDNFVGIFEIIKEIIEDGEQSCQSNQQ